MIIHENTWYYGNTTTIVICGGKALCKVTIDNEDKKVAWLSSVIVHPSIRRNGYGNMLLNLAILKAKEKGAKTLHLCTDGWMVEWYKRHGFYYSYTDENGMSVMKIKL